MKNIRSFTSVLIVIGLMLVFLVSTDTFAIDQKVLSGRSATAISTPATIIYNCPRTVTVTRSDMVKYCLDPEWQPGPGMIRDFTSEIKGASVDAGKINCIYSFPYPEDPNGGVSRLYRNIPQGYQCDTPPTPKGSVICKRQAGLHMP